MHSSGFVQGSANYPLWLWGILFTRRILHYLDFCNTVTPSDPTDQSFRHIVRFFSKRIHLTHTRTRTSVSGRGKRVLALFFRASLRERCCLIDRYGRARRGDPDLDPDLNLDPAKRAVSLPYESPFSSRCCDGLCHRDSPPSSPWSRGRLCPTLRSSSAKDHLATNSPGQIGTSHRPR